MRTNSILRTQYEALKENYNVTEYSKYKEQFISLPSQAILENSQFIYAVNENGAEYYLNYVRLNTKHFSNEELSSEFKKVNYILENTSKHAIESLPNHNKLLKNISESLTQEIKFRCLDTQCLNESYKETLQESFIMPKTSQIILNSLKLNPFSIETDVSRINNLLESYRDNFSTAGPLFINFLPVVTTLAENFSDDMTDNMVNLSTLMEEKINNESSYTNLTKYTNLLNEAITRIQYTEGSDVYYNNLVSLKESLEYKIKSIIGSEEIVTEGVTNDNKEDLLCDVFVENYMKIALYDELNPDEFRILSENLVRVGNELGIMEEATKANRGPKSAKWKVSNKIDKASRNFMNTQRDKYDTNARNTSGVDHAKENIAKTINYPINKFIASDKEERKSRIIEGRFRSQIWKWLRRAVTSGAVAFLINPLMGCIVLVAQVAVSKGLDEKVRKQIIQEMETELKVVNAKIEDAQSESSKKEKYELIRIREKLQTEIKRIKYRLGGLY